MKKTLTAKELTTVATLLRTTFPRRFKLIARPTGEILLERAPVGRPRKVA